MRFTSEIFKRRIAEQLPPAASGRSGTVGPVPGPPKPPPEAVSLADLYNLPQDEDFLREAYRRILGREADAYGFVRYREMLRNHIPRNVVIGNLVHSDEARRSGRQFAGLQGVRAAAGHVRHGLRRTLESARGTIVLRIRNLLELLMQGWRFEMLDLKMDSLRESFTADSERVYRNTEERLCQLSEKLDTYVVDVQTRQQLLFEAVENQQRRLDSLARVVSQSAELAACFRQMEDIQRDFGVWAATLEARWREIGTSISGQSAAFLERSDAEHSALQQFRAEAAQTSQAVQNAFESLRELTSNGMSRMEALLPRQAVDLFAQHLSTQAGESRSMLAQLGQEAAVRQQAVSGAVDNLRAALTGGFAGIERRMRPPAVPASGVVATEVDGFIVGVPAEEWRLAAYHVFRGTLEPGLSRAFRGAIQPGMVVVDVGANVGIYTLTAARLTGSLGKVIGFEPSPGTFAILRDNIQVNGFLETGIVDLRQVAATDKSGAAPFIVYPKDSGHSTLFAGLARGDEIQVETDTLDHALREFPKVDVVKVDAEGAEPFVLRGMRRIVERNPQLRLFIEFAPQLLHYANIIPEEFLDELEQCGFEILAVNDVTGDLESLSREELLGRFSVNLSLRRRDTVN